MHRTDGKNYRDEAHRTTEIHASTSTRQVSSPHARTSSRLASNHFYTQLERLKILPTRRTVKFHSTFCFKFHLQQLTAHIRYYMPDAQLNALCIISTMLIRFPLNTYVSENAPCYHGNHYGCSVFFSSLVRTRSDGKFGKYDNYS